MDKQPLDRIKHIEELFVEKIADNMHTYGSLYGWKSVGYYIYE